MTERLRAMFCDHLSIMRGKYLPASKMRDDESRVAQALFSVHYDKDLLIDAPHSKCREGIPDMVFRWKADEIREGWEPETKVVVSDLHNADGSPLPLCPRGALKRAQAAWGKHELSARIGLELEAYAFVRNEEGALVPYDNPGGVVYGTGNFTDPERFTDAIWNAAEAAGFRLELITAEYDTPQYEFTLAYDEAVRAVDEMVLFRQMAREIAWDHGILLTFLPKPILAKGGNGLHVNLSFADRDGHNALANGDHGGPDRLNDLGRGCIAGLDETSQGPGRTCRPDGAVLRPPAAGHDVGLLVQLGRRPSRRDRAHFRRRRQEGAAGTPHAGCFGQPLHGGGGGPAGGAAGARAEIPPPPARSGRLLRAHRCGPRHRRLARRGDG